MKTLKIATIATMITLAIIALCGMATAEDLHTETAMVIGCEEVRESLWIVSCIAEDGNMWAFYEDEEPWDVGDLVTLSMYCDEVLDVEYIDHLEGLDALRWLP